MLRPDGRSSEQLRPLRLVPNYTKYAAGSVLIELGETKVICAVTVEESVPHWLRTQQPGHGWLTAEYSLLPSATNTRTKRERPQVSGRTQEIQRLIGRSLRGVIDLSLCPDITFTIDCDVIQADGGTRTAAITGAFVALKMAVDKLMRKGRIRSNPLRESVAAVSVGIVGGELNVDLCYAEDSVADVDMNIVMTSSGKFLEVQGTAERKAYSREQLNEMVEAAATVLGPVFESQLIAAEGREVEA
jgi:ribonuclease PH